MIKRISKSTEKLISEIKRKPDIFKELSKEDLSNPNLIYKLVVGSVFSRDKDENNRMVDKYITPYINVNGIEEKIYQRLKDSNNKIYNLPYEFLIKLSLEEEAFNRIINYYKNNNYFPMHVDIRLYNKNVLKLFILILDGIIDYEKLPTTLIISSIILEYLDKILNNNKIIAIYGVDKVLDLNNNILSLRKKIIECTAEKEELVIGDTRNIMLYLVELLKTDISNEYRDYIISLLKNHIENSVYNKEVIDKEEKNFLDYFEYQPKKK